MSWFQRVFKPSVEEKRVKPSPVLAEQFTRMPTVKFDPSKVTERVKADLRRNLEALPEVPRKQIQEVYDAALSMIEGGGNMATLYSVLLKLDEMNSARAKQITRSLNQKARAFIEQESRAKLGITHATWMYANAPCMVNPSRPTDADRKQDAAHRAAHGQRFSIEKGCLIDGKYTLPGRNDGCKCSSRSVFPGRNGAC